MKILAFVLLLLCSVPSAFAQDQQSKGVSTYGGAAPARKLYAEPVQQTPNRRSRGGGTYSVSTARSAKRDFVHTMASGGLQRSFIIHIPANYQQSRPAPLLFVFHGMNMTNNLMPPLTGMNSSADRYGYVVVYPQGYRYVWNDGLQHEQTDDVGFVQDIIGFLSHSMNIDQRRIYAAGISNGGYFVQRLACEIPNRIAGIGVVAASGLQKICNSCGGSAVPAVFFLGTEDSLVPRDGTAGTSVGKLGDLVGLGDLGIDKIGAVKDFAGLLSQQEAIDWWARHNGAGSQPRIQAMPDSAKDGCKVTREIYGGGRRAVEAYIVEGGGHTWPGGLPFGKGIVGRTTGDINASELMCEFFRTH